MEDLAEVKTYSDFKSPYAFLAFDPAFALEDKYKVKVKWKPFQLRLKGKGQRSVYSEYKVKYSYMDARRWANLRGGLMIRGPLKIFDTTPALIGGLYAEKHGKIREYGNKVFDLFFKRELAADEADAIAPVIASIGLSEQGYPRLSRRRRPGRLRAGAGGGGGRPGVRRADVLFQQRAVLGLRPPRPARAPADRGRPEARAAAAARGLNAGIDP